jgi:pimeloyl-ACP methyl ester carboxylesterase
VSTSLLRGRILRAHTGGDAPLEYLTYCPETAREDAALLVAVHGYTRNAAEQAERFAPLCEAAGVVLAAPHFDAQRHRSYQRLSSRGARADLALDAMVAELRASLGLLLGRVALFGYSGGGQFVHRTVLAHPQRYACAAIAAPGWFTFPTREQVYPLGLRGTRRRLGLRMRPEAFLRTPLLVAVGEHDDDPDADNLRRAPALDAQQGTSRLERATRWVRAMEEAALAHGCAPQVRLALIPNAAHSFADCMDNGLGELVIAQLGVPTEPVAASAVRKRLVASS